ncbi:MAG: sigma-54-dependent transcriptional regulator [Nitrospirota bacterium]
MHMNTLTLTGTERQFIANVLGVMHANPFSDQRVAADRKLIDFDPSETYTQRYEKIDRAISQGVNRLLTAGKDNIHKFEGQDRDLIESLFLYHAYNQVFLKFDELIEQQLKEGDRTCGVPFARESLGQMERFGFAPGEALHFFALFYQLRRAYYFIMHSIVGRSLCMKTLRENLWNNVITSDIVLYARHLTRRMEDYSTLLLGGTGSGKGISARAIGQSAYIPFDPAKGCFTESFTRTFVYMNLSQFPEQLIESELFGHRKGSFTGAIADHDGALSRCSSHGAILLDEIGDVPTPVQIKLLHVLEERVYSPVGSHEKKRFPGRIIGATNRPLGELRASKAFRDDFYYRLCSDIIEVPTLRQRIQEDPLELDDLVRHMVVRIMGERSDDVAAMVLDGIRKHVPRGYAWPGNVRELEQCIRRIVLKRRYETDQGAAAPRDNEERLVAGVRDGALDAQQLLSRYCKLLYERHGSYEAVAKRTALDRRTVKRYIVS